MDWSGLGRVSIGSRALCAAQRRRLDRAWAAGYPQHISERPRGNGLPGSAPVSGADLGCRAGGGTSKAPLRTGAARPRAPTQVSRTRPAGIPRRRSVRLFRQAVVPVRPSRAALGRGPDRSARPAASGFPLPAPAGTENLVMCGIAGYVGWARGPDESAGDLAQMCEAIRHRGPDDAGYFIAPGVALGMRRLSIIDVAGGAQPIANEDRRLRVVFNGEIYNYQEIRSRLEREGHRLVTGSDTETLVHLYEDHGPSLVQYLRGMFAFALWDARRQTLLLARDRFGIKPLYYWQARGGLAFASELPSLQAMEWFPGRIDRRAVRDYLAFGYVPDPHSVFEGVRKLGPGQLLVWERDGSVRVSSYWSPSRAEQTRIDEREAAQELRRLLADAVRYHLVADVPLGAFLSGGVDSSVVVAEMSRQMDRPVQTFSIGFEEPEFNEAKDAAAAAKAFGTEHTALIVHPDVDALIEDVVASFDEPFGDSSAIPTYLVCRLARQHITVALSGDRGDELFGGYSRYLIAQRQREIQPSSIRHLIGALARRLPYSAIGRNRVLDLSRTRWGRYAATLANPLQAAVGAIAEW